MGSSEKINETEEISTWLSLLTGGLLSSSCCLIQLILNLLASFDIIHVGCAGFNKVLGPLRPVLRAVTLIFVSKLWYNELASKDLSECCNKPSDRSENANDIRLNKYKKSRMRLFVQSCVCLLLMYLPECLREISKMNSLSSGAYYDSSSISRIASFLSSVPVVAPPTAGAIWKHYQVHNMGCEACSVHVQNIVQSFNGVVDMQDLNHEDGKLSVLVNSDWGFDEESLKNQLFADGYEVEAVSDIVEEFNDCAAGGIRSNVWSTPRVATFRLLPGMDLKLEIQAFAQREEIAAGSIISCVGSLKRISLRLATKHDEQSMETIEREQFFEIVSLTGTVAYEKGHESNFHIHLHMSVCDDEGQCIGGHVLTGNIVFTTAEITVVDHPHLRFSRIFDSRTGFKELVVESS